MSGGAALINFPGNKLMTRYLSLAKCKAEEIIQIHIEYVEASTKIAKATIYFTNPAIGPYVVDSDIVMRDNPQPGYYFCVCTEPVEMVGYQFFMAPDAFKRAWEDMACSPD